MAQKAMKELFGSRMQLQYTCNTNFATKSDVIRREMGCSVSCEVKARCRGMMLVEVSTSAVSSQQCSYARHRCLGVLRGKRHIRSAPLRIWRESSWDVTSWNVKFTPHIKLVPRSRECGAMPPFPMSSLRNS